MSSNLIVIEGPDFQDAPLLTSTASAANTGNAEKISWVVKDGIRFERYRPTQDVVLSIVEN